MATGHERCQNDGTVLTGDYCHTCGQRADEPRRVFIGLVQDVFVDTLAIDGKLARTIGLLLWRPGVLATRYLNGKRVSYSPPFRLYLFASVFFFIAAFWIADFGNIEPDAFDPDDIAISDEALNEIESRDPEAAARLRALMAADVSEGNDGENVEEGAESDSDDESENVSLTETKWEDTNYEGPDWLEPHVKQMFEAAQRAAKDPRLLIAESRQNLPRTLLLAPVLYALILLVLYFYRRKFYVYDHFVISLYMHAALYAYLLLAILLSRLPVIGGWAWFIPLIWGWIQPAAVLRQAYGSGRISMVIKWAISMLIYVVGVALIVSLGLSYSLYQS